ncbi:hypothetical protein Tco_0783136 [Tanacetum coccineum]
MERCLYTYKGRMGLGLMGLSMGLGLTTYVSFQKLLNELTTVIYGSDRHFRVPNTRVGHVSLKTDSSFVSQGTTFKAVVQPDLTNLPGISRKQLYDSDRKDCWNLVAMENYAFWLCLNE